MRKKISFLICLAAALLSCQKVESTLSVKEAEAAAVSSREVARMLSNLPIGQEQLDEVFDAVSSSSGNGYDEEYTMKGLFSAPGAGVGEEVQKASSRRYSRPLRDMISEYLLSGTKAQGERLSLEDLQNSGLQIYWPWFDNWDGSSLPAITFDPGDGSEANIAYLMEKDALTGEISAREITVDENYAAAHPVWVVNSNSDAAYTSLELLRRGSVGSGGGEIIIGKSSLTLSSESGEEGFHTLLLQKFKAMRNYDSWFAGGSEFFVKFASVEDFKAVTDEEMMLYNPSVTDFIIVVKRKDVGKEINVGAVLVDKWTDQLSRCALMVTEDDGGTWTSWKTEIELKIYSKTYGLSINLPIRSRDDIVWRGSVSGDFLKKTSGEAYRYGDVEMTFEMRTLL